MAFFEIIIVIIVIIIVIIFFSLPGQLFFSLLILFYDLFYGLSGLLGFLIRIDLCFLSLLLCAFLGVSE